jgi:hypothetical protein
MDDLHQLGCAELYLENETAVVKFGQANRHFMAPLATSVRPMIVSILFAHPQTQDCGPKDLRDPSPAGRISCLSAIA